MNNPDLDFQTVYEDFQPKILRYLARLAGEAGAEDLTQEVFIKVNQSLKNFRGDSSLATWIYRIATNAAFDKLRCRNSSECLLDGNDEAIPGSEKKPSIEKQLIRAEMNECVRGYIEKLPESYRVVLVLSEYEGLKNSQITEILGVTLNTVKIRLHRARAQLKEELETNCEIHWIEEMPCSVKIPMK